MASLYGLSCVSNATPGDPSPEQRVAFQSAGLGLGLHRSDDSRRHLLPGTAEQQRRKEDNAARAAAAEASDAVAGDGRAAAAEARMAGTGDVDDWMGLDTGQVGYGFTIGLDCS